MATPPAPPAALPRILIGGPSEILISGYTDTSDAEVPQDPTTLPPSFRVKGTLQQFDSSDTIYGLLFDETGALIVQVSVAATASWTLEFDLSPGTGSVDYDLKVAYDSSTKDNASDTGELTVLFS
jgi:hypothetical protein